MNKNFGNQNQGHMQPNQGQMQPNPNAFTRSRVPEYVQITNPL